MVDRKVIGAVRILRSGLLFCALLSAACGSADSGTSVLLRNGSDTTLHVREVGINSGADIVTELAPGSERKTLWRFSTGSKVTLKAEERGGQLVFCHQYTYDEIRQSNGEITLVKGKLDCN